MIGAGARVDCTKVLTYRIARFSGSLTPSDRFLIARGIAFSNLDRTYSAVAGDSDESAAAVANNIRIHFD